MIHIQDINEEYESVNAGTNLRMKVIEMNFKNKTELRKCSSSSEVHSISSCKIIQ